MRALAWGAAGTVAVAGIGGMIAATALGPRAGRTLLAGTAALGVLTTAAGLAMAPIDRISRPDVVINTTWSASGMVAGAAFLGIRASHETAGMHGAAKVALVGAAGVLGFLAGGAIGGAISVPFASAAGAARGS